MSGKITAAASKRRNKPPPIVEGAPEIPDFLGVAGRVQTVSNLIEAAQEQQQGLRAQRLLNGHEPTDLIPVPDGVESTGTYAERSKQLEEGVAALLADNEDIRDELIAEAVKRRREREQEA